MVTIIFETGDADAGSKYFPDCKYQDEEEGGEDDDFFRRKIVKLL